MKIKYPYVIKRNGESQRIDFDKILVRIERLCDDLDTENMDIYEVIRHVFEGTHEGVRTKDLDDEAAKTCAYKATTHPDFAILAARIEATNLQKETPATFSECVTKLMTAKNPPITKEYYDTVMANKEALNAMIYNERDLDMSFFGLKTLQKSYLLKADNVVVERPQYMWMRVAVTLHGGNLEEVAECYEAFSMRRCTQASPTLFNAGTRRAGYSSCFLTCPESDSIEGMYKLVAELANISKLSGGIGVELHKIRSSGAPIKSVNGEANGIIPYMQVLNYMTKHVTQAGKRPGSIAVYLSPHHPDIENFLRCRLPTCSDEMACKDLFTAMWIPDIFMERVSKNEKWSLFDPDITPGLADVYGNEYRALYEQYERDGRYVRQVDAQDIWSMMIQSMIESGMPYVSFSDSANLKNNMKNDGIIRSSNLCNEILQPSNDHQSGVCVLASIGLPAMVKTSVDGRPEFDHDLLYKTAQLLTRNLDRICDLSEMPDEKTRYYIQRNRSIGIGVSGLADVFFMMRYPFGSEESTKLNAEIFETIYFASLSQSKELAKKYGRFTNFDGSEFSRGRFQFDMWPEEQVQLSGRWDWDGLRKEVVEHGTRNALLTCCMPTASTSQILNYSECFEPMVAPFYTRRVLGGEFVVVNQYLMRDLYSLGLWNERVKTQIMEDRSVQNLDIPDDLKMLYRTAYEIKLRPVMDLSASRAPFVDQTQSLNLFITSDTTFAQLSSAIMYAHRLGLKTGSYYIRQPSLKLGITATSRIQIGTESKQTAEEEVIADVCTMMEGCMSCSA